MEHPPTNPASMQAAADLDRERESFEELQTRLSGIYASFGDQATSVLSPCITSAASFSAAQRIAEASSIVRVAIAGRIVNLLSRIE